MGHRSSFLIKLSFGIGHPPAIHQIQCICVEESLRVRNLQMEFNYLDSFKSYGIFSDFIVPTWSPSSLRCPRHPHIIPIAPRRSPCGLHGLWSPHVVPVVPVWSPSSPHCLEGPNIIPNPPDTNPFHPPSPGGWRAPNQ